MSCCSEEVSDFDENKKYDALKYCQILLQNISFKKEIKQHLKYRLFLLRLEKNFIIRY